MGWSAKLGYEAHNEELDLRLGLVSRRIRLCGLVWVVGLGRANQTFPKTQDKAEENIRNLPINCELSPLTRPYSLFSTVHQLHL